MHSRFAIINTNERKTKILSSCIHYVHLIACQLSKDLNEIMLHSQLPIKYHSLKFTIIVNYILLLEILFFLPCIIWFNIASSIEILMMIYFICSITAGIAGEFIAIVVVQTSYRFLHLQNQCECVTTALKNLWRTHDGLWKIIEFICCFSNWILYCKK